MDNGQLFYSIANIQLGCCQQLMYIVHVLFRCCWISLKWLLSLRVCVCRNNCWWACMCVEVCSTLVCLAAVSVTFVNMQFISSHLTDLQHVCSWVIIITMMMMMMMMMNTERVHMIEHRWPDTVVIDQANNTALLMDITVPQDTSGQVSISDRGTKEAVEIGKLKWSW